jgi:hypothetical protein
MQGPAVAVAAAAAAVRLTAGACRRYSVLHILHSTYTVYTYSSISGTATVRRDVCAMSTSSALQAILVHVPAVTTAYEGMIPVMTEWCAHS